MALVCKKKIVITTDYKLYTYNKVLFHQKARLRISVSLLDLTIVMLMYHSYNMYKMYGMLKRIYESKM